MTVHTIVQLLLSALLILPFLNAKMPILDVGEHVKFIQTCPQVIFNIIYFYLFIQLDGNSSKLEFH